MLKFETGKKYSMKSICDSECIWEYTVIKRTAKTIKLDNNKSFRVKSIDDTEFIFPLGRYSMCPILKASKEVTQ